MISRKLKENNLFEDNMRKRLILTAFILTLILSGCNRLADDFSIDRLTELTEEQIRALSGIEESETYTEYRELAEEGKLNDEGVHDLESEGYSIETDPLSGGSIHVTFAENSFLKTAYYADREHSELISGSNYRVDPGDIIYAGIPVPTNPYSNMYRFDRIVVKSYDRAGFPVKIAEAAAADNGLEIQIPENCSDKELSIEALGQYKNRILSFTDYYADDNGKKHELEGSWYVNGQKIEGDSIEISPTESFTVTYRYPEGEKYYYVGSMPLSYYHDDAHAKVAFEELNARSDNREYAVELQPYRNIDLTIRARGFFILDTAKTITINGAERVLYSSQPLSVKLPGLKAGETIRIESPVEFDITGEGFDTGTVEKIGSTFVCDLTVKGPVSDFIFDPAAYPKEHGKLVYKYRGMEITDPIRVIDGSRITYEAAEIEEGWWLPDYENSVQVNGDETKKLVEQIRFFPVKDVTVTLPQPEYGGTVRYFSEGTELTGNTAVLRCGSAVRMEFQPRNGWISKAIDGTLYIVKDAEKQNAAAGELAVDRVFVENDTHKPLFRAILDPNLGAAMKFSISASGLSVREQHYVSTGLLSTAYTIAEGKIGTEKNIMLSVSNEAILSGTALRYEIRRTDSSGNTSSVFGYILKLPYEMEIPVYAGEDEKTVYKSVEISFRLVNILEYSPKSISNGTVTVSFADVKDPTPFTDKESVLLDKDREVSVSITPADGWCVTGPYAADCAYTTEMKYEKFTDERKFGRILSDHPIQIIPLITFNTEDDHGICTYRLDGEIIEGRLPVRPYQWLTVTYEVTDPEYRIDGTEMSYDDIFSYDILHNNEVETWGGMTIQLPVENLEDGQEIRCADYFYIKKKGS